MFRSFQLDFIRFQLAGMNSACQIKKNVKNVLKILKRMMKKYTVLNVIYTNSSFLIHHYYQFSAPPVNMNIV